MPVTLSIENAPDEIVERLTERAARHGRSLQGEMDGDPRGGRGRAETAQPRDVLTKVRELGLSTPREGRRDGSRGS